MGSKDSNEYSRLLIRRRTEELLTLLRVTKDEQDRIFKYPDALERMKSMDKQERQEEWERMVDMLRQDSAAVSEDKDEQD